MITPRKIPDGGHDPELNPVEVGETVSNFELPGAGEDGIEMFSLSEFTEDSPVIISFYPFDFSPVCTEQLCGFRDTEWLTFRDNLDVIGISVDSAYSHVRFRDEYGLSFPLLTDRLATVAGQFGVKCDSWENHPAVCGRSLFAVDSSHTVQYTWFTNDANEQPSSDDLLDSVGWM